MQDKLEFIKNLKNQLEEFEKRLLIEDAKTKDEKEKRKMPDTSNLTFEERQKLYQKRYREKNKEYFREYMRRPEQKIKQKERYQTKKQTKLIEDVNSEE